MAELKKIRVREAKPRDVGLFSKLWREFMIEQQNNGSVIKGDSDKGLEVCTNIFKMYADSDMPEDVQRDGVVLFIGEVAVFMAGDPGNEVEMTVGRRPAHIWGMYVMPDQREKDLGVKLYEEGFKRLKEMGFDVILCNMLNDNAYSITAFEKAAAHIDRVPESLIYAKLTQE